MMKFQILPFVLGLLALTGPDVLAVPINTAFTCQFDNGSMATGCSLPEVSLFGPQDYAMSFQVDYLFHCSGNRIDVGLITESGFKPFERGDQVQRLSIDGKSFLKVGAIHPQQLYAANLSKDCSVSIVHVTTLPSEATLKGWQAEAALSTVAIHDALDTWLLARDLDRIVDFDNTQFVHLINSTKASIIGILAEGGLTWEQLINPETGRFWDANTDAGHLPSGWQDLVTLHGDLVDLILLFEFSSDVLQGRPPTHNSGEVEVAAHHVKAIESLRYLGKLKARIQDGQNLVNRAKRYLEVLSNDLHALNDDLTKTRDSYPVLR